MCVLKLGTPDSAHHASRGVSANWPVINLSDLFCARYSLSRLVWQMFPCQAGLA